MTILVAVKNPQPQRFVRFDPENKDNAGLPTWVEWRWGGTSADDWRIHNERHDQWVEVRPGDHVNVTDRRDVYPVRDFHVLYTVIVQAEQIGAALGAQGVEILL